MIRARGARMLKAPPRLVSEECLLDLKVNGIKNTEIDITADAKLFTQIGLIRHLMDFQNREELTVGSSNLMNITQALHKTLDGQFWTTKG